MLVDDTVSSMLIFVDEHAQPVVTAAITTGDGVVLAPRFAAAAAAALKEGGIVELPAQSHPGFLLIGGNFKKCISKLESETKLTLRHGALRNL